MTQPIFEYRAQGRIPRIHGNGFVQLDLEPGKRLHIWGHRDIPRQRLYTGIHDHRFDFRSTCIVGRVFNIPYLEPKDANSPQFKVYHPEERDGEDTVLKYAGYLTEVRYGKIQVIAQGMFYSFSAGNLHETTADVPSATIMEKQPTYAPVKNVRVLVPLGFEPDNDFNRNNVMPVEAIWDIIFSVIGQSTLV